MKIVLEENDIDDAVREWIASRHPNLTPNSAAEWVWVVDEGVPASVTFLCDYEEAGEQTIERDGTRKGEG